MSSKEAVPYLRVSGRGQIEGDGFARQLETCQKRAAIDGLALLPAVREEGVSGTKDLADRPALSALLEKLSSEDGCKTVIVERADRLARDLIVSELLLRECRELGIRVLEAESGRELTSDDLDDPTSRLIRQILSAVAEFDKNSIVLKLRKARQRKKRLSGGTEGCEGRKPYGMKPGEAAGLERLRQLRSQGLGPQAIAEILTRENIPSRGGKPWRKSTVHRIIGRSARPAGAQ